MIVDEKNWHQQEEFDETDLDQHLLFAKIVSRLVGSRYGLACSGILPTPDRKYTCGHYKTVNICLVHDGEAIYKPHTSIEIEPVGEEDSFEITFDPDEMEDGSEYSKEDDGYYWGSCFPSGREMIDEEPTLCHNCDNVVFTASTFCPICDKDLRIKCPECGFVIPDEYGQCPTC